MKLLIMLLLTTDLWGACLAGILEDDTRVEFQQITYEHNHVKQTWSYQQDGVELSYLSVTVKGDRATVNLALTHSAYRGRGYQDALFQEMFARNPQIRSVDAVFVETNLSVFEKTYKSTRGDERLRCTLAAMQTPTYKTLKRGGIVKVTGCEYTPELGVVRVTFTK